MPTVFRHGPYRFYFYSHDIREPVHVHVDSGSKTAKIWIADGQVARNLGFSEIELREIRTLVTARRDQILEAWYEHFGK